MSFRGSPFRGDCFRGGDDKIIYSEKKRRNYYCDTMFRAMDDEMNNSFGTPTGKNFGPPGRERSPHRHKRSTEGARSSLEFTHRENYDSSRRHKEFYDNQPRSSNFHGRGYSRRHGPMESRFNNHNQSRSRSPIRGREFGDQNQKCGQFSQRNEPYSRSSRRSRSFSSERRFLEPRPSKAISNLAEERRQFNSRYPNCAERNFCESQHYGGLRQKSPGRRPSYRIPSPYRHQNKSKGYRECGNLLATPPSFFNTPYMNLQTNDSPIGHSPLHNYSHNRPRSPLQVEQKHSFENENDFFPIQPFQDQNFELKNTSSPCPEEKMSDFFHQPSVHPIEKEDLDKMNLSGPGGDPKDFLDESKLSNFLMPTDFEAENPFDTTVFDSENREFFENDEGPNNTEYPSPPRPLTKKEKRALYINKKRIRSKEEWDEMIETHGEDSYKTPEFFEFMDRRISSKLRKQLKQETKKNLKINLEKCDNPIAVPVVLNQFPVNKLNGMMAAFIKQYISSKVEEENLVKPKFSAIRLEFGVLMIYCNDQPTVDWVKKLIFNCPPIGKYTLTVTNTWEITMLRCVVYVCTPYKPLPQFLASLASQNPLVQTKKWCVLEEKKISRREMKYFIEMSEKCWNEIKMRGEKLLYNGEEIHFKVVYPRKDHNKKSEGTSTTSKDKNIEEIANQI